MSRDRQHQSHLRTIFEDDEFKKNCREFTKQYPSFDKVYRAIRIELQEYAHINPNECHGFWWKDTNGSPQLPPFVYLYKFDDKTVTVYSIEEDDDSGS